MSSRTVSSSASQVDLSNLFNGFKATQSDTFKSLQPSVIKVLDNRILKNSRDQNLKVFFEAWDKLSTLHQMDVCKKSGINPINFEKNKQKFDLKEMDEIKDSKLQKLAYLSRTYLKLQNLSSELQKIREINALRTELK